MASTERLVVELPAEFAAYVRGRSGQGGLGSDREVVMEALRALQERDAVDDELRGMIAEADADLSPTLTEEEVTAHFRRREQEWLERGNHAQRIFLRPVFSRMHPYLLRRAGLLLVSVIRWPS